MMSPSEISKPEPDSVIFEAETGEFAGFIDGLLADLSNASDEVREFAFNFLNLPAELVSFECSITAGAVVVVLLKPSQRLIDLGIAVRTGNFDFVLVEHPHGFSFVENGLVELPILSALEKPPKGGVMPE